MKLEAQRHGDGSLRAWDAFCLLDADEQLLERDRLALFQLVGRHTPHEGSPRNAFKLLQKNSSDGGCTGMLVSTVRLFPNRPEIRYEWPIHEQVVASLTREGIPIEETSIEVLHDGYSDPSRNIGKQARNRDILQRQVDSGIEVYPVTHFLLAGAKLDLGYPADALRSYQDCIRVAPAGDGIAEGARVRVATCLNKLGRQAEALAGMPSGKSYGDWHPELLKLKGDCERALGNSGAAREAYRGVLGLLGTAFIPPCWLR